MDHVTLGYGKQGSVPLNWHVLDIQQYGELFGEWDRLELEWATTKILCPFSRKRAKHPEGIWDELDDAFNRPEMPMADLERYTILWYGRPGREEGFVLVYIYPENEVVCGQRGVVAIAALVGPAEYDVDYDEGEAEWAEPDPVETKLVEPQAKRTQALDGGWELDRDTLRSSSGPLERGGGDPESRPKYSSPTRPGSRANGLKRRPRPPPARKGPPENPFEMAKTFFAT